MLYSAYHRLRDKFMEMGVGERAEPLRIVISQLCARRDTRSSGAWKPTKEVNAASRATEERVVWRPTKMVNAECRAIEERVQMKLLKEGPTKTVNALDRAVEDRAW